MKKLLALFLLSVTSCFAGTNVTDSVQSQEIVIIRPDVSSDSVSIEPGSIRIQANNEPTTYFTEGGSSTFGREFFSANKFRFTRGLSIVGDVDVSGSISASTNLLYVTNNIFVTNAAFAENTTNWIGLAKSNNYKGTFSGVVTDSISGMQIMGNQFTTNVAGTSVVGPVLIDSANLKTNTFGGLLTILGTKVQEGDQTDASGNNAHAEGILTVASGNNSHSEGYDTQAAGDNSHSSGSGAYALHNNTFVWSDGTYLESDNTKQFSARAENGFRFLGGPIYGNGAGLTNVSGAGGTNITYTTNITYILCYSNAVCGVTSNVFYGGITLEFVDGLFMGAH